MKFYPRFRVAFFLALSTHLLLGCQKMNDFFIFNEDPQAPKGRLIKTTTTNGSDSAIEILSYDFFNLLKEDRWVNNLAPSTIHHVYSRNRDGYITSIEIDLNVRLDFLYKDSSNQIASYYELYNNGIDRDDTLARTYCKYDLNNRLIEETLFFKNSENVGTPDQMFEYVYDGKGNVIERSLTAYHPNDTRIILQTYTYDNNTNPYHSKYDMIFYPDLAVYRVSPNNITTEITRLKNMPTQNVDTVTYAYTYDTNHKPLTRVSSLAPGYTMTYYYR